MANRNISATVQIGATMASSVGSVFGGLKKRIDGLGSSLAKLKRQSGDIAKLQTAQGKLAEASSKGNAAAVKRYSDQVEKLSASLREAGVDTSRLASEQQRLAAALAQGEARMAGMTRLGAGLERIRGSAANVGSAFGKVKDNVTGLATKLGVLGGVAAYGFKTQFIDVAAEFEKLQTILTTLEGGNVTKAKQAFGWISEFAAKTPYDIKQVSDAFVRLRAYGIDPIQGDTLRVLGDTASSMGKDVMDAVEAIADAVTGENERLKEFGIKAAADGGRIIYSYTDRAGKQRQKAVDAGNRKLIQSTLTAIWNEKYAGSMEAQSKTWAGMMSNMGDQWTRFTTAVMAGGLFTWMKTEVGGILDELNRAAQDGRLKDWAKQTGESIKAAFISLKEFAIEARSTVLAVKDFVGGWKNLGIVVGGVMLAPTITSVVQLGIELGKLTFALGQATFAFLALHKPQILAGLAALRAAIVSIGASIYAALGPWGLFAGAVALAATAIYANWEPISKWWTENIHDPIYNSIVYLTERFTTFKDMLSSIGSIFSAEVPAGGPAPRARFEQRTPVMPTESMPTPRAANQVKQNFQINVTAPSSNPAAVGEAVKSALKSVNLYDSTGVLAPQ